MSNKLTNTFKKMSKGAKIALITVLALGVTAAIVTPITINAINQNKNNELNVYLDDDSKTVVEDFKLKKNENDDYVATLSSKDKTRKLLINEVKIGNEVLSPDKDYTFVDNKLTIKKSAITSNKGDIHIKVTYKDLEIYISGTRNVDIEESYQYVATNEDGTVYDNAEWTVQPADAGTFTDFGYFMPSASYYGGKATLIATIKGKSNSFEIEIGSFNKVSISNAGAVSSSDYEIEGKVVIPSRKYNETTGEFYAVTKVQTSGFKNCPYMTSVIIPPSITDIEMNAFLFVNTGYVYPALTQVAFVKGADGKTGIKNIGKYAFKGQMTLTSFHVPDSLVKIEKDPGEFEQPIKDNAFEGCANLRSVIIDSADVANQVNSSNNLVDNAQIVKINSNISLSSESFIAKKYVKNNMESSSDYYFYELVDGILLGLDDVKTNFKVGDAFTHENLVVRASNNIYGIIRVLEDGEYTVTTPVMTSAGYKEVVVSFKTVSPEKEHKASYYITISN